MVYQLYEVVRYGSDLTPAGPDGPDTCYLIRASSPEEAAEIADRLIHWLPHERVQPFAHVVHLLGQESIEASEPGYIRGPYYQHAYASGWPTWRRDAADGPWILAS